MKEIKVIVDDNIDSITINTDWKWIMLKYIDGTYTRYKLENETWRE